MTVLNRLDIIKTERKRSEFNDADATQDLSRLLGDNYVPGSPIFDLKTALDTVSPLIKYLELLENESNHGLYSIKSYDFKEFLRLDLCAIKALNLVPTNDLNCKTMSLFKLLNHCKTSQGSRLLAQWIKQPLMNLQEIGILFYTTTGADIY